MQPSDDPHQVSDGIADATATTSTGTRRNLARTIPWIVTVGILIWILKTTDLPAMWEATRSANLLLFFGAMFGLFSVLWVVDSIAILWIYRRYHAPAMTLRHVLPIRGTTYVVGILNYAAASAAMAFYFKRRWSIGVVEGGASLLLLLLVDLGLAILTVAAGAALLPAGFRVAAWTLGAAFAVGAIAHLIFWRAPWSWGPLERLRNIPQLRGFREARLIDYAIAGVLRVPVTALYVGMHYFTLMAFNIRVPLENMLVYVPVQMVLAVIPISVSGLGPGQAAQRVLYTDFAASTYCQHVPASEWSNPAWCDHALAAVDAYGLALFLGFLLPRILIGVLSLRAASRELAAEAPPTEPDASVTPGA
jgi:hypothetical protein